MHGKVWDLEDYDWSEKTGQATFIYRNRATGIYKTETKMQMKFWTPGLRLEDDEDWEEDFDE